MRDPSQPVPGETLELVAVGRSENTIRGRQPGRQRTIHVRAGTSAVLPVEGELFTVAVRLRQARGSSFLVDGTILAARLEAPSLGLRPLALRARGRRRDSAGEVRTDYEMELAEPRPAGFSKRKSPLDEARRLWDGGDVEVALTLAAEILRRDLRCLAAHALLGKFALEGPLEQRWTEKGLRHFRAGAAIGGLSLPADFDGVLRWAWPGNRPLLRCLLGRAVVHWRLGEAAEAAADLERLLALDPEDALGAGPCLESLAAERAAPRGLPWVLPEAL